MSGKKTWGGRFSGSTDERVEQFTESISFDHRLFREDVRASQAHARMLSEVGLITKEESEQLVTALDEIQSDIEQGKLPFTSELEDIHTHIEQALIQKLGDVGRKLHTARSRNDQIATDVKLWCRGAIDRLDELLQDVQRSFVTLAENHQDLIIPAYTHLQRAQPVLAAHYCLAYVEKFQRDRERLQDCRKRVNVLPLGSAALAGTTLPIQREIVARELEFDAIARNSLDVSSDRDFLVELVFDLTMIALHLSGWAEEWILWATTEFDFLNLPDAFCTGSSIMPHKKNPDVLELIRGKAARVVGDLQQLLVLIRGLPLAYNRDLQEDKEPLFDAHDTVAASLELAAALVAETTLRADRITAGIEEGFLDATTLMEHCISQGMPMRSAHEAVGQLVRLCEQRGCRLADLPPADVDQIHPNLSTTVYNVLGAQNAVNAFQSEGSTAPTRVKDQLAWWKERLS